MTRSQPARTEARRTRTTVLAALGVAGAVISGLVTTPLDAVDGA